MPIALFAKMFFVVSQPIAFLSKRLPKTRRPFGLMNGSSKGKVTHLSADF